MAASAIPDNVPNRAELLRVLGERAREGNVQAAKLLLEEHRRAEDDQPGSGFDDLDAKGEDELAPRRHKRARKTS